MRHGILDGAISEEDGDSIEGCNVECMNLLICLIIRFGGLSRFLPR